MSAKIIFTHCGLPLIMAAIFFMGATFGYGQTEAPDLWEMTLRYYYGLDRPLEEYTPDELNRPDGLDLTPLMKSVLQNDLDMLKKLLAAGARADFKNENGRTALHEVFNRQHGGRGHPLDPEIIRLLVRSGLEINVRDNEGASPLLWACLTTADSVIIKTLLELGADPQAATPGGYTPILAAAMNPEIAVIQTVIEAGGRLTDINSSGDTALILAAESNSNPKMIALLLEAGLDAAAEDVQGQTALHRAAAQNPQLEITRMLLAAGADPNQAAKPRADGLTPTLAAVKNSNPQVIRLLAGSGGDLTAKDVHQKDALMIAVNSPSTPTARKAEIVRYLLGAGLKPDARSAQQATALHYGARYAAYSSVPGEVELLLEAGADP